jgi:hypothetical protein
VLGPPTLPPTRVGVVTPPAGIPAYAATQYGGPQYGGGYDAGGPYSGGYGPPNTGSDEPPSFDAFGEAFVPAGYEPERRSPGKAIAAVVATVLCIALVVGGVVLVKHVLGSSDETPPRGGGPTATATPTQKPTGAGQIPTGYTKYTNSNAGYSVGIPAGWSPRQTSPSVIEVKNPENSSQFLRFLASGGTDPLGELTSEEPGFAGSHPGYQKVSLAKADYRGLPAADWEFTFPKDGATRHVLYRLFLQSGHLYGIYLSAPEDTFSSIHQHFDTAAATFATPS